MTRAHRTAGLQTWMLLPVLLIVSGVSSYCAATEEKPGVPLVGDLFEAEVLADNVFRQQQLAKRLPAQARYEFLKSHVLPGKLHLEFRLFGKLTPTDPPESEVAEHSIDVARVQAGTQLNQRRIRTGGILVSPVFDLIESAKEADKLDELRLAVQAAMVSGEAQQRCQLSMLAMIAIAKGDLTEAVHSADDLYQRFLKQRFDRLQDRMPETLFLWMAAEYGVLLDEAVPFLISIQDSQIRANKSHGPAEWDVLMMHLIGRIRHHKLAPEQRTQPWTAAPDFKSWHWVPLSHSLSSGIGKPPGHVQVSKDTVDVFAKMDDEFLLFTSPMRGNYTLECLCTCFGWKDIHPLINGEWIAPVWHHESVQVGEIFRPDPEMKLQPTLSRVDNWLRYRVDVRDGVCSRYINSRLISREPLPEEHDPWLAIRNVNTGVGSVRNVRITGEPVVPDEVRISELHSGAWETAEKAADVSSKSGTSAQRPMNHVLGWIPWHEEPWTPEENSWILELDSSGVTQFVGHRSPELAGTGAERMLRYLWPLVWDSEVTYEFFYKDGESIVHPAIGRRAFLLQPNAVRTHNITNGVSENSGLDPLHQMASNSRVQVDSLPLKSGEWNRMTVQISGDTVRLRLNEIVIHESAIAPTNDRSFGLFYYCDQAEARVRNVILRGDWPKSVPPVTEQELRGTDTDVLDRERESLAQSFEFDFTATNAEEVLSTFAESLHEPAAIKLLPEGLQMSGIAKPKGKSTSLVGPRILISGDFDVIAEFGDLKLKASDNGIGAIFLGPRMPGREFEAHLLYRGMNQHPGSRLREVAMVEVLRVVQNQRSWGYPASFADDCRSGRLRVARRGTTYHYLIAPLDSENFRLLHSMEISDDPILPGNFMLRTSCYSQGVENSEVSVVWKNMSVRAESIAVVRKSVLKNLDPPDPQKVDSADEDVKWKLAPAEPNTKN